MIRDEEYEHYADPENQEPQGPARRRKCSHLPEIAEDERADGLVDPGADGVGPPHAHEA